MQQPFCSQPYERKIDKTKKQSLSRFIHSLVVLKLLFKSSARRVSLLYNSLEQLSRLFFIRRFLVNIYVESSILFPTSQFRQLINVAQVHFLCFQCFLRHMDLVQFHICAQNQQLACLHRHHHRACGQFYTSHAFRLQRVENEYLIVAMPYRVTILLLIDNSGEERILEGNELGGNQHGFFLTFHFLCII